MEVELKLLLDPSNAQSLRDHPSLKLYARSAPREEVLKSTYFDTPDLQIRRNGGGLRVRCIDGNDWIQTLKLGGSVAGGLHSRHEWEFPINGPTPDLGMFRKQLDRKSTGRKLLASPAMASSLAPIFSTQVKRTLWDITLPSGDVLEFVLDQGTLEHGDESEAISEIEIELKSGDPVHLFDFALALIADIPLHVGNLSKADRGYALLSPQPVRAIKASRLTLSPELTVEQAFQRIVTHCMAHVQANEAAVANGHDVESLHQMRVGLRRLRSAIGLFDDVLALPAQLRTDLDWIGTQLGVARDWDVLAGSTLPAIANAAPRQIRVAAVKLAALRKAREHHQAASIAIGSTRYAQFILGFTRWVQASGWRAGASADTCAKLDKSLPKFAQRKLQQHWLRLLKRGSKLKGAAPQTLHRVRITAKKMRYATEFFASLYDAKSVRPFAKTLSALQDRLGWINDVAVADELLKKLHEEQPDLLGRASTIRGFMASHIREDKRTIHKHMKKLTKLTLPG